MVYNRTFIASFERHHDERSIQRQRSIANLTVIADLIVAIFYVVAIYAWNWNISSSGNLPDVALGIFGVGFVLLLGASSLFRGALSFFQGLGTAPPGQDVAAEPVALMRSRKYLFYGGVIFNIVGLCILIEATGGIIRSPYTAVLYVMILCAQQLGRFRTNSLFFIVVGVTVTALLFLAEALFGISRIPHPPSILAYLILASAFLITALFTHSDKARNFRATGGIPDPTHIEVYRDGRAGWRYVLYRDRTRIDSVLHPQIFSDDIAEVQTRATEVVGRILHGEPDIEVVWSRGNLGEEMMGEIRVLRE